MLLAVITVSDVQLGLCGCAAEAYKG
jgi:hypothetical protein